MKKGYSFQYGWLRPCLVEATPSDEKGVALLSGCWRRQNYCLSRYWTISDLSLHHIRMGQSVWCLPVLWWPIPSPIRWLSYCKSKVFALLWLSLWSFRMLRATWLYPFIHYGAVFFDFCFSYFLCIRLIRHASLLVTVEMLLFLSSFICVILRSFGCFLFWLKNAKV